MEPIQNLTKKWESMLDFQGAGKLTDPYKRAVTAILLENTENDLRTNRVHLPTQFLTESPLPTQSMLGSNSTPGNGPIDTFDPVLISMVRRAAPVLNAYDFVGVQPLTMPTGLIFAMRARYSNNSPSATEALFNEVNTMFSSVLSGANTFGQKHVGTLPAQNSAANGTYNTGTGMSRAQGEALGTTGNASWAKMGFTIERQSVEANTRALASEYSLEMAQDLKAVHQMDARSELINILSMEITAEINREIVRTINFVASIGCQENTQTAGIFDLDTDSNGRWSVEKWKGLMFQLDREANAVAKATRRGKANMAIMTSDVASALQAAGNLDFTPALNQNNLNPDDTGSSYVGVLNGKIKCYIDPYASGGHYVTMGYKGTNPFDAGIFYCPYVPLQLLNAIDPDTFTPRIGFKTRYALTANPFAEGITKGGGALNKDANVYYRKFIVSNLM